MINALSVDVEDYFHVSAFENVIYQDDWPKFESRVDVNCNRILTILDEFNIRATFFILGWIAQRNRSLVEEIKRRGHEIASHGFWHRIIYRQTQEEFREDLKKSKSILEDILGCQVQGFRAPSYSITNRSMWALRILVEEGFKYDSSIFPIRHDRYGIAGFFRFPQKMKVEGGGEIVEFPPSTVKIAGQNIPIGGGGYLRIFPLFFTLWGIRHINIKERNPALVYIHPWEIDPDQPRIKGAGVISEFRHYRNLHKTEYRIKKLLEKFSFGSISEVIKDKGEI